MNHHHGGLCIPTVGRSGTAVTTHVCRYLAMTSDSHSNLCVQVMLVGAVGRMQFGELLFRYVLPNEIKHLWLDATPSIEGSAGFLEKPHGRNKLTRSLRINVSR